MIYIIWVTMQLLRSRRVTVITISYFVSVMDRGSSEVSGRLVQNVHRSHGLYPGPPEGWQGAPPSRGEQKEGSEVSVKIFHVSGCEVYVTRIPRDCFEQELLPVFSRAGEIYEMRLMMDHNGLNRGYACVKFTNTQVRGGREEVTD